MISVLRITDGSPEGTINLLSNENGFYLDDWTPATADPKNGGIWQESPFVDGRRLAIKQYTNITDTFAVGIAGASQDQIIYWTQQMRRLLRKASEYWSTGWQNSPVWIEAQAECESELRYALICDGRLITDDNPYNQPFVGTGDRDLAMTELTLTIEHQYWTAQRPETAECIYLRNHQRYPWTMWLSPSVATPQTTMYSTAVQFDNMPAADFTCEMWLYGNLNFAPGYLFWKTGYYVRVNAARQIECFADYAVADATLTTATALPVNPQGWTHIAATIAGAGAKTWAVWINGVAAGGVPVAGNGAYAGDAATDQYIGSTVAGGTDLFTNRITAGSRMTWARFSNSIRYAAPFVPFAYNNLPPYDANTICLTNGHRTMAATAGNIAWVNNFDDFYTSNILNVRYEPNQGLLGVESYLENYTSYLCDIEAAHSTGGDREGCGIDAAFWNDVSLASYGSNVVGNLPANLMPAIMAIGDTFMWCSAYYQGNCLPCTMVIELNAPIYPTSQFVVEFWNGAWVAANWYETSSLGNNGFAIIAEPEQTAALATFNGYYGYWYRLRWLSVGAGQKTITAGPALISNPALEIENTTARPIQGDLSAIARIGWRSALYLDDSTAAPVYSRRSYLALYNNEQRDESIEGRDQWFTPYLNLAYQTGLVGKPKNQPGISITAVRPAGVVSVVLSAYGASSYVTRYRVTTASTEYITLTIREYVSFCYRGKYRVFARMRDTLGGAAKGDVYAYLYLTSPYATQVNFRAQPIPILYELLDFGILDLPAVGDGHTCEINFTFVLQALVAGNHDIDLFDLILLPMDEWTAEINLDLALAVSSYVGTQQYNDYWLLDPVTEPKKPRSSISAIVYNPVVPLTQNDLRSINGVRNSMSNNQPIIQANSSQKLYCLQGMHFVPGAPPTDTFQFCFCSGWSIEKVERYDSMRGDR